MEKKINYLSRDFNSIKEELIKFSNQYYPELSDDFNDSSVGSWFIDLVSAVGDDLSYHTDRMYQETNVDSANLRSTILNQARANGFKIPGRKASMCEVEISCELPPDSTNISIPDYNYAPVLLKSSIVSAGPYNFELSEDVDFYQQFNSSGYSNRTITPSRDSNGNISAYTVSKTVIAINGNTKIYKKIINENDLKPFMTFILPEQDVMNIESIIFKESSDYSSSPELWEFYVDEEEYRKSSASVVTYRFFECDSLADQWRFGTEANIDNYIVNSKQPEQYEDYTEFTEDGGVQRTTRYYVGRWKPITQKFITEYTDNGYIKIIFGAGNGYGEVPESGTTYSDYMASNLINNNMLGVLPKEGWSMFVLYRTGGGASTNLGPGSINTISLANIDWKGRASQEGWNGGEGGKVINSLKVKNLSTAVAGKDMPSEEEIKQLMKYNTSAQNRAVVVNDYKVKLMQMPPKYGAPFRACVVETNNKIEMDLLGLNASGKLDSALPDRLVRNIIEYLSHYKQINDYIEIKSGKIYNIGLSIDVFINKNYNASNVIETIINTVYEYFRVNKHDMGDDIFLGDLEKEITLLDGVISLISLRVYKIWNGSYSSDKCPLPEKSDSTCDTQTQVQFLLKDGKALSEEIDLMAIDKVLYGDFNSMYEIKNPTGDIQVQCRLI